MEQKSVIISHDFTTEINENAELLRTIQRAKLKNNPSLGTVEKVLPGSIHGIVTVGGVPWSGGGCVRSDCPSFPGYSPIYSSGWYVMSHSAGSFNFWVEYQGIMVASAYIRIWEAGIERHDWIF